MTSLLYLDDSYLYTGTGTVQSIEETEFGTAVTLDQTIFYPQGGGQPCDHGTMTAAGSTFDVQNVRLDPEGVVHHFGVFTGEPFAAGAEVELAIDKTRRMTNARNHSGGHLLDCAVERVGITGITPTKGHHFPGESYVQYDGELDEPMQYKDAVEEVVNALVAENMPIVAESLDSDEANKRGISAPPGKSARFVTIGSFTGCGCGGTHVQATGEIGPVTIRKISSKKGVTKISYDTE